MLEQLLGLVRETSRSEIIDNPAIPSERNDEAVAVVTQSVAGGLQNAVASGETVGVLQLLGGKAGDPGTNPLVQNIGNDAAQQLAGRFNLDQSQAAGIAGGLIPQIFGKLINRTNDPSNNGFDLGSIFNSLTGGKAGGVDLSGILGKLGGGSLDRDGDGDTDLQDVIGMFTNGARQQQQSGGGGLMDLVKGFMR